MHERVGRNDQSRVRFRPPEQPTTWRKELAFLVHAMRYYDALDTKQQRAFRIKVERMLMPVLGPATNAWFAIRERLYDYKNAPKEIRPCVRGNPNAERLVIWVPGMFGTDVQDGMSQLYDQCYPNPEKSLHKEGWIALNWLYSGRDLKRIHTLREYLKQLIEKECARGAEIRIVGFSVGGIIAETVVAELAQLARAQSKKVKIGFIMSHAPFDPFNGFLVRWANIEKVHEAIGFTSQHNGHYPIIVLTGDEDVVVPPGSDEFVDSQGVPIKENVLVGSSHRKPLKKRKAQRRMIAALRRMRRELSAPVRQE